MAAEFHIRDADLVSLKGQVIVVTGGSSGIGLATTTFLLSLGAHIVVGDLTPFPTTPPPENLTFVSTDVSSWPAILNLFTTTVAHHGRVDHVFANAGIAPRTRYLQSELDPKTGALLEPGRTCLDVNLHGCLNTAHAGIHFMRNPSNPASGSGGSNSSRSGSVVCTASASSFQRFSGTDYAVAKHGVLGFVRGVTAEVEAEADEVGTAPKRRIRINAVAPSWTRSGIVSADVEAGGRLKAQGPEVVARNVALFMADEARAGQVVYSADGRYFEVEEAVMLPAVRAFVGDDSEGDGIRRVMTWAGEQVRKAQMAAKERL